MKKEKYIDIFKSFLYGILCFIAFNFKLTYKFHIYEKGGFFYQFFGELRYALKGFSIESAIITIALAYFIYKVYKKEKFNVKHVIAIIFSLLSIIGKCIISVDKLNVITYSFTNFFVTILTFFGYFIIYKIIIDYVFKFLESKEIKFKNIKLKNIYEFIFERHPFMAPFIILLIIYLPYLIITYPGTLFVDALNQLNQYDGIIPLTNHHPVISTLLTGFLFNLGRVLVNQNFGIFLYVIIQFIIELVIFSLVFMVYKKENVKNYARIITLIYMSIFCVFKIYAVTIVKDTYFSLFFILFFISIYYYVKNNENQIDKKSIIALFLSGLLVFIFRNNGIYIVLGSLFFLIFINKDKKRIGIILALMLSFFLINTGYHKVFMPSLNAIEGGKREMFSIPLQQTARYIKYHKKDLTLEDKKVLKKAFTVKYSTLARRYDSKNADRVKAKYNTECKGKCASNFFKFWLKGLKSDPLLYIDSFISNYSGYLYPSQDEHINMKRDINGLGNYLLEYYDNEDYDFSFAFPKGVKTLQAIAYTEKQIPVLGLIYSNGFYSWLLIIIVLFLFNKKAYKKLIIVMPIILTWAFLFLGPIDTYLRYVLPIMLPLFMAYSLLICSRDVKW